MSLWVFGAIFVVVMVLSVGLPALRDSATDGSRETGGIPSGPVDVCFVHRGEVMFTKATLTFTVDADGVVFRAVLDPQPELPGGATFEVRRGADGDGGRVSRGEETLLVRDEVEPATLTLGDSPKLQLYGLQVALTYRLTAPFVRFEHATLAFVDPAVAAPIVRAFRRPEEGTAPFPWTLDGATRFVAREMEGKPGVTSVVVNEPGEIDVFRGEHPQRIFLGNVFPDVMRVSPAEGRDRLLAMCRLIPLGTSGDVPTDAILPRVLPGNPVRLEGFEGKSMTLAAIPFAEDLSAVFVHDLPDAMSFLGEEALTGLVPDRTAWLPLARANLRRTLGEVRVVGAGPYMLTCGGNYENALALLPETFEVLEPLVGTDPLVAVMARDLLFVARDTPEQREAMARLVETDEPLSYAVSDGVYVRNASDGTLHRL